MNVYIVGAGAIGTWFGDRLREIGCSVTYAPRNLADVVPAAAELAVVAVKAYDTPGAVETLKRALGPASQTTILCLQNGVGNEELLAAAFGADAVVAGALTVPVERLASGAVSGAGRGGLGIAPFGRQANNWLIATLGRFSFSVVVAPDAQRLKWSKLALNCVANAACAILDMLPAEIVSNRTLFALECDGLQEIRAVMRAMHVQPMDLPRYPVNAMFTAAALPASLAHFALAGRIARGRGTKAPSLLLDLRDAKRNTEVAVLHGAVVKKAAEYGIAVPINSTFARVLPQLTESPEIWERYRKRPDALLADIRTSR